MNRKKLRKIANMIAEEAQQSKPSCAIDVPCSVSSKPLFNDNNNIPKILSGQKDQTISFSSYDGNLIISLPSRFEFREHFKLNASGCEKNEDLLKSMVEEMDRVSAGVTNECRAFQDTVLKKLDGICNRIRKQYPDLIKGV